MDNELQFDLNAFTEITKQLYRDIINAHGIRPNAVCVSRKIYNILSDELNNIQNVLINESDKYRARIEGLQLFVNDDMPDAYISVGQAKVFVDMLINKKKSDC